MNEINKIENNSVLNSPELGKEESRESFVEHSPESYKDSAKKSDETKASVLIETSEESRDNVDSKRDLGTWGVGYTPERVTTSVENLRISNSRKWIAAYFEKFDKQKAS